MRVDDDIDVPFFVLGVPDRCVISTATQVHTNDNSLRHGLHPFSLCHTAVLIANKTPISTQILKLHIRLSATSATQNEGVIPHTRCGSSAVVVRKQRGNGDGKNRT